MLEERVRPMLRLDHGCRSVRQAEAMLARARDPSHVPCRVQSLTDLSLHQPLCSSSSARSNMLSKFSQFKNNLHVRASPKVQQSGCQYQQLDLHVSIC